MLSESSESIEILLVEDTASDAERTMAALREGKVRNRVVWVQDGNKVKAVPITIGLMDTQFAELVSGEVKPGDVLVTGTEGEDPRARR